MPGAFMVIGNLTEYLTVYKYFSLLFLGPEERVSVYNLALNNEQDRVGVVFNKY